jgi:hypothetical protein
MIGSAPIAKMPPTLNIASSPRSRPAATSPVPTSEIAVPMKVSSEPAVMRRFCARASTEMISVSGSRAVLAHGRQRLGRVTFGALRCYLDEIHPAHEVTLVRDAAHADEKQQHRHAADSLTPRIHARQF